MWVYVFSALIWLLLTYKFGIVSFFFLLLLLFVMGTIKSSVVNDVQKKPFKRAFFGFFIMSVFKSAVYSFLMVFYSLTGKVYRGIYEQEIHFDTQTGLFFFACGVTIVPDTIYLGRISNSVIIHKVASSEKKAHMV